MTAYRLIFIFFLFVPVCIFAEGTSPIATDSRVRITAPNLMSKPLVGTVARIQPDTLVLIPRTRIPLDAISKLEISLGVQPVGHRVRSGAWKGVLLGAGFVAAAAVQSYDDWDNPDNNKILFGILGGGAAGGVLGGLYGAFRHPERWRDVPPDHLKRYAPPPAYRRH